MTYRETGDKRFLNTAIKMADFFIDHANLPADMVPYWDFNANTTGYTPGVRSRTRENPVNYRDASAAAVTASALLELSSIPIKNSDKYRQAAIKILHSLADTPYRARAGTNSGFILQHCVGSIPHGVEIDVPLVYADYYFLEALNRYKKLL
jgi:chondroitin AC lyase